MPDVRRYIHFSSLLEKKLKFVSLGSADNKSVFQKQRNLGMWKLLTTRPFNSVKSNIFLGHDRRSYERCLSNNCEDHTLIENRLNLDEFGAFASREQCYSFDTDES